MRILIVDDSSTMRRIVSNIVNQFGVEKDSICEADDGLRALNLSKQNQYDLIITDWNMPNLNGLELVQKLRAEGSNNRGTKIIMLTTEGGKQEVVSALKNGANDYVVKPINPQVLQEKLKKYLI